VQQVRQRGAAHLQYVSPAFETLRFSASMISVLIRSAGWSGFFIGILGLPSDGHRRGALDIELMAHMSDVSTLDIFY